MASQISYSSNVFTLSTTPENNFKGKTWYNSTNGYLQVYYNDKWNQIKSASDPTKQDKLVSYKEEKDTGVTINGYSGGVQIAGVGLNTTNLSVDNGFIKLNNPLIDPNRGNKISALGRLDVYTDSDLTLNSDVGKIILTGGSGVTIDTNINGKLYINNAIQATAGSYFQVYDADFYTNYDSKSIEVTKAYPEAGDTTFTIKNNTSINGNINYTGILQKNGTDILATKQDKLKFYSEADTFVRIETNTGCNVTISDSDGASLFSPARAMVSGDGGVLLTQSNDTNIYLNNTGIEINGAVSGTAVSTLIPESISAVNTKLPSEKAVADAIEKIFERIYPIGSVYISVNEVNPSSLFGGTWDQIKDRFLLATGDIYSPGVLSGEATHTLTIDEIPEHNHNLLMTPTGSTPSLTAAPYRGAANATEFNNLTAIQPIGGNQPHNNMPPYLTVYMWKRTK